MLRLSLRGFAARYFPNGSGPTMSLAVCMFTNTSDNHFVIDLHPDHPQVSFASPCSGHGFKFASVVGEILADLAIDPVMAASQIHRFLVLHKELDADDEELTRTRKVRRGLIASKYAVLIDALYGGRSQQFIETQVKFEDGRTGSVSATLNILDTKTDGAFFWSGSLYDSDGNRISVMIAPLSPPCATNLV